MRPELVRTAKFALIVSGLSLALSHGAAWSQTPDAAPPPAAPAEPTPAPEAPAPAPSPGAALPIEQSKLADKYKRLEELLLRRAEVAAATDPERATLLRQVVSKSKDSHIENQFEVLVELLAKADSRSYTQALSGQAELTKDLKSLLELLASEDRSNQLESEKARIKEYLKRVNKLIRGQKSLQGQTENGADAQDLADRQTKLAGDAGKLAGDLKADDDAKQGEQGEGSESPPSEPGKQAPEGEGKQGAPQDGDSQKQPGEPQDGKQGEGQESEGKQGDSQGKQSEGKPGEGKQGDSQGKQGEPQEGQPSDGKAPEGQPPEAQPPMGDPQPGGEQSPGDSPPMPGQPGQPGQPSQGQPGQPGDPGGDQPPPDEGNPARKRIQAAEERMKKAAEKLEKAERKDAVEEQEQARRELEQAAAELERILRQLREEEVERMLVALEARFRKMLEQETEVHQATKRLGGIPADNRDREVDIEAGRLSRKQGEIGRECDKALTLLREEGSAVAFPEAVTQMREDMQLSTDYLAQAKVDRLTQGVQEDIIAALEEMIAALEKAIEELQQDKNKPPPGSGGGEPGDEPLVDQLAELKMIRSLQLRVNRRTAEYGAMIKGEQADQADLLQGLQNLADRQDRIYRSTRDIVVGRNE